MRGSREETGGPDPKPMKINKVLGFFSNTGPVPLENHKATNPGSMLDHHRLTSETPFKRRFAGGPMMACF